MEKWFFADVDILNNLAYKRSQKFPFEDLIDSTKSLLVYQSPTTLFCQGEGGGRGTFSPKFRKGSEEKWVPGGNGRVPARGLSIFLVKKDF